MTTNKIESVIEAALKLKEMIGDMLRKAEAEKGPGAMFDNRLDFAPLIDGECRFLRDSIEDLVDSLSYSIIRIDKSEPTVAHPTINIMIRHSVNQMTAGIMVTLSNGQFLVRLTLQLAKKN